MSIRPLNARVILRPKDTPDLTSGGIAMPDTVRSRSNEGEIVAVGKGHFHPQSGTYIPIDLEVGARVLFLRWSGYLITYNGEQLISVEESEILCEVDKDDEASLEGMIVKK